MYICIQVAMIMGRQPTLVVREHFLQSCLLPENNVFGRNTQQNSMPESTDNLLYMNIRIYIYIYIFIHP